MATIPTYSSDDQSFASSLDPTELASGESTAKAHGAAKSAIESIGVYLPQQQVSTADVLAGCKNRIRVPLERLTGIQFRRRVSQGEYSIDLAAAALADCLARSRHKPEDFDLIICTNISRYDGPRHVSYEPSTAMKLRQRFGLKNALAFDLSNACAGMWSGVYLVDAMIRSGEIRRGLVISGEYITHLTETAQQEITDYMDPQLASLTLGDAGVAVALEASSSPAVGFHRIEMYTLSKYSKHCIAKAVHKSDCVAAMYTDAIKVTAAVVPHAVTHAEDLLRRLGQPLHRVDHFVPHQTSRLSMMDAIKEIQSRFGVDLTDRLVNNLTERGNTSSTSHFLALRDAIVQGRIRSGENIVFCISGSGQTTGTAVYTCDNLPERLTADSPHSVPQPKPLEPDPVFPVRVAINTIRTYEPPAGETPDSMRMLTAAAEACIAGGSYAKEAIDAVISVGMYRTDFIMEPALAALVAGELAINDDREPHDNDKTFAFDLSVGAIGFLKACYVAGELLRAGSIHNALILASEVENNREHRPERLVGLRELATATLLHESPDGEAGFVGFMFRCFDDHVGAIDSYGTWEDDGIKFLAMDRSEQAEGLLLDSIEQTVQEFLREYGLNREDIAWLLPPQISPEFVTATASRLGFAPQQTVNIAQAGADPYTSSPPLAIAHVQEQGLARPGELGLVIAAGAGIQVACALYQF